MEDLLTSTPHDFQSLALDEILHRGSLDNCDGVILDWDSWQRCTSLFKYFGVLEAINSRPIICLSRSRSHPPLKYRNPKLHTGYCPLPAQTEDLHTSLQEMSSHLVAA